MNNIALSLVIPAYNEEDIIESTLLEVISYLSKKKYDWEVVVADDGSTDDTAKIVEKFSKKGVKLVSLRKNQGKGAALRRGILKSKGKYVVFSDADLSVPITTLSQVIKSLDSGNEVVIGSRRLKDSKIVVHQPWLRENLGRVFTLLTKIYLGTNVSDFTCGFKGFTRASADGIFSVSKLNRWAYDSEVMFIAKKKKFKIKEIPVTWTNRANTRVRLGMAVVTSLLDLLKIRYYDLAGRYAN